MPDDTALAAPPADAASTAADDMPRAVAEPEPDAEKLVPVGEAIRYRRRAQQAEQSLQELHRRVAALEQSLAASREDVDRLERRGRIDSMLVDADAVDLETARLLTEAAVEAMDEPDVKLAVDDLLRPDGFAGGEGVLAVVDDAAGLPVLGLAYDADAAAIRLLNGHGEALVAADLDARAWHHVEFAVDTANSAASLWTQGRPRGDAPLAWFAPIARCRIGLPAKGTDAAGGLDLDEIVLADGYVGPRAVAAASPHADDPARWLVVFNRDVAESLAFAERYRARRGIPHANVLGVSATADETIDAATCGSIADDINRYLAGNALDGAVVGVALAHRMPTFVEVSPGGEIEPLAALLQKPDPLGPPTINPLASDAIPERPTPGALAGVRLTASLDAPSFGEAVALLDRADALRDGGPLDPSASRLWLAPYFSDGPAAAAATEALVAWGTSDDREALRLETVWSRDPGLGDAAFAAFDLIDRDAFFFGWSQAAPPPGFFGEPAGPRACCVQFNPAEPTATTVRDAASSNWITAPLAAGYASAIASSRATGVGAAPRARPFFEALRRGWTIAEAWLVALPELGRGPFLVGDPLLTVSLPRDGWDVYAASGGLGDALVSPPVARLPLTRTSWAPSDRALTTPGTHAWVVARVDDAIAGPGNAALAAFYRDDAGRIGPAAAWLWPEAPGWRPRWRHGEPRFFAAWSTAGDAARVDAAELESQAVGSTDIETVASLTVEGRSETTAVPAPPATPTRYRWRLLEHGRVAGVSPWSTAIDPPPVRNASITLRGDTA